MAKKTIEPIPPPDSLHHIYDGIKISVRSEVSKRYIPNSNTACFMGVMKSLGERQLRVESLEPHDNGLSPKIYLKWIALCKENQLIPETARASSKRKGKVKYLEIVKPTAYDKHIIYAALCCYRWADTTPQMAWQIMEHMDAWGITFWQALHYGVKRWIRNSNHTFFPSGELSYIFNTKTTSYSTSPNANLSVTVGMRRLFNHSSRTRKTSSVSAYNKTTHNALLDEMAGLPTLSVKINDLLDPKWVSLIEAKLPNDAVVKLYKEIKG